METKEKTTLEQEVKKEVTTGLIKIGFTILAGFAFKLGESLFDGWMEKKSSGK